MASWKIDILQNLAIDFIDGDRSSKYPKREEFVNEGIPFINADSISAGYLDLNKSNFITKEKFATIKKGRLQNRDIIFTTRGNGVGNIAYFYNICPTGLINAQLLIVRAKIGCIDSRFLYYLFKSQYFQAILRNYVSGSAQPQIPIQDLKKIKVSYPLLPTQQKIASILSAYDDLIENNTRRIQILEEMAQTLYQEWFVKFRFPGHEQVKMVDSDLGLIPEGWEVKELEDLYKTSSGGTPSRKANEYYESGDINWVKTRELKDNFIFDTEEKITELGLKKSSAKLFPQNTVLIAMYGATIGKLAILANPSTTNQACCAILSQTDLFSYSYIFSYLLENREKIFSLGMGAAQQNISQQVIKKFQILKPTNEVMDSFNEVANSILEMIKILQQKNDNLQKTRDLLLPKLISGQIDVENLDIDTGDIAA